MAQFFSLLIGYFIGAMIQTSYWYGRMKHIDIRDLGSGNAGTTNAMRSLGKKAGLITGIGDVTKVFLATFIAWIIFKGTGMPAMLIFIYAGLGTLIGHDLPFYMGFKGGKGVATLSGMILSLMFLPVNCWIMSAVCASIFFIVLFATRYASLASLCLTSAFFIQFCIFAGAGKLPLTGGELAQAIIVTLIACVVTFIKHRGNIGRLLTGTERRIGSKK
ncbi:MAG: glycerol-3-phosphate 1-O-acyltransferase PlsY [Clostridiales bacterium]|nr:glycerol-3-phosphate 1-O-acyltransferase PlsY [Clostridiales bacterium]MBS5877126.1 glycerol-3-phosphate 1-O-acyltransferase PlsY [Clostridiales bacterium]MDU0939033.1 glycerol-3-phosphate 1-O-acyltransferase PlsY [Clostridiales bacterium]MDU1041832.1 glycerol-3-phosphate 1-O-acyltransferase PlsY [Clostridiales bacterium]MDU3490581.1 glycerol-3-phosphate 1-O-acyltransferase PlsY [Clostridiales bacterium]